MTLALSLLIALALDAVFGEPEWLWRRLPHPAVLMGRAVAALERRLNREAGQSDEAFSAAPANEPGPGRMGHGIATLRLVPSRFRIFARNSAMSLVHPIALNAGAAGEGNAGAPFVTARRLRGVAALLILVAGALLSGLALAHLPVIGEAVAVIGAAILLAHRSLVQHVGAVAGALERGLPEGRRAVSLIVGRDPETLDESGVARAAIESAAENFSDGVIAPAFWFAVAGLPGILVYKAVNTADSMIGHRSARYREFGWAAARLDDLLNLIPARLSGALICLAGLDRRAFRLMLREAGWHKSPNAGWPEAATAAVLGIALAGPRVYGGVLTDDRLINAPGRRELGPHDIRAAVRLLWRVWAVTFALVALIALAALA